MRFVIPVLAALVALLLPPPAAAHHSFAMFDRNENKVTMITGVVKELDLINPHGWLKIVASDPHGHSAFWSFEMASVVQLTRLGWNHDVVKPGDKVTVGFFPLKYGSFGGELISVVLPGGQTLEGLNGGDRGYPAKAS